MRRFARVIVGFFWKSPAALCLFFAWLSTWILLLAVTALRHGLVRLFGVGHGGLDAARGGVQPSTACVQAG